MCARGFTSRRDHRSAIRERARARLAPRPGPLHPHRRRTAHQQFPAVEPRLHGALLHGPALAGVRHGGAGGRRCLFRFARAAFRAHGRAAGRPGARRMRWEGLGKRVVTAVVLVAVLLAVILWLPPVATVVVLTIAVLAGAWEWSAFLKAPDVRLRG